MKSALHRIGAAGVGMMLLGAAGLSQAEPRIQAITSSIQGGTEVVKIDLSEPLSAVPAGFVVQSPARIALDFPGVGSELQRSAIELKHGNLRAAQVVQAADRTRVVLSLSQPTNYRAEVRGNSVLVSLDPAANAQAAAAVPVRAFSESGN
ncbi:MAG TPA: AMIN domain-containing protein, partial [Ottowia sp.]|nr:AMIN domain-containing protein [Ottowia sp.]